MKIQSSAVQPRAHTWPNFKWPFRAQQICAISVKLKTKRGSSFGNLNRKSSSNDALNSFTVLNVQFSTHNTVNSVQ